MTRKNLKQKLFYSLCNSKAFKEIFIKVITKTTDKSQMRHGRVESPASHRKVVMDM